MKNWSEKYELVIGLEIHVQLQTASKIFSQEAYFFGKAPNTQVHVISLAHPGTLPSINKKAVEFAVRMGLACQSEITRRNIFARKNYFYPDLPKGYQLTQDKDPICVGGWIEINDKGTEKKLRLHHIHLEEDAGKSLHQENEDATFLDFNRAGVPLIEMVTEPDLRSAQEAYLMMQEVRKLVRYLDISDGDMEKGSLRCDANVSVRPKGQEELGTRVEVKNINSFNFVRKAILYEFERQCLLLEEGGNVQRETRRFDAEAGRTFALRSKEQLNDYRYFPDPDLSPVLIDDAWLETIRSQMPALPNELSRLFTEEYHLTAVEAALLTENKETAAYFLNTLQHRADPKLAANWICGEVKAWLNQQHREITAFPIKEKQLTDLLKYIQSGQISQTLAKQQLFPLMLQQPDKEVEELILMNNLLTGKENNQLETLIGEVLAAYPEKVKEYKKGKKGLLGMFMGELMKKTQGKADPKVANQLLTKALEEA